MPDLPIRHAVTGTEIGPAFDDPPATASISFSAIISALSFAIDLTEGAVPGHALRACILGMRIGQAMGLPPDALTALYYALLLKDIGYSNAVAPPPGVDSSERTVKWPTRFVDWTRPSRPTRESLQLFWEGAMPNASSIRRIRGIGRIGSARQHTDARLIALRCERGSAIVAKLGLGSDSSDAIHALDEHWDGTGFPSGYAGDAIPLLARILSIAQHLDLFASDGNARAAVRAIRERSGSWFDPEIVRVAVDLDRDGRLWYKALPTDPTEVSRQLVLAVEPAHSDLVQPDRIDRICEAFADVVDAKSPFTYRHSVAVAEVATALAVKLNLASDRQQLVRRAALLHDLGKLGIPNMVLEKSSPLNDAEWQFVIQHPKLTREILARIEPFTELAEIAGAHHEKLDGSGYPDHLAASDLNIEARIVAVADIYQAMTEGRPYRAGMTHIEALDTLRHMTPHQLDADCVRALEAIGQPLRAGPAPVYDAQVPRKGPLGESFCPSRWEEAPMRG